MGLYLDQIDDICLEVCFEMHKKLKCGLLCIECDSEFSDIICKPGHDIFGHTQSDIQNTNECFTCVNCSRVVVASRYAPHLEKCMGLGRSSSRIATKRLAVAAKNPKNDFEQFDSDPDDRDFDYAPQEKALKKEKHKMPKKLKKQNTGNTPVASTSEMEELLLTTCGVISTTTKKMCTKTLNCPQHTDQMREEVRTVLLGKKVSIDELRDNLNNKKPKTKKTEKTDYDSSSDSMAFVDVDGVDD